MPGKIDGLVFATMARDQFPNTPIIIASANQVEIDKLPPLSTFLPKPWTEQHLVEALKDFQNMNQRSK